MNGFNKNNLFKNKIKNPQIKIIFRNNHLYQQKQ